MISSDKDVMMAVEEIGPLFFKSASKSAFYTVIFITEGSGTFFADIGKFSFNAPVLLFATPLQKLAFSFENALKGFVVHFHGDFYCIEYHKTRVACNGLLFNNIYLEPSVDLSPAHQDFFKILCRDMMEEISSDVSDEMVLRSYLQLFLAKSSSIKLRALANPELDKAKDEQMEKFKVLLETYYLTLHKPADYAELLAIAPNTLSKKCQLYFAKPPSLMIQERLVLEAKKELHLTTRSIKEIAFNLNFSDEYYFSRFFKKFTGFSPQAYRNSVGISIVAGLQNNF